MVNLHLPVPGSRYNTGTVRYHLFVPAGTGSGIIILIYQVFTWYPVPNLEYEDRKSKEKRKFYWVLFEEDQHLRGVQKTEEEERKWKKKNLIILPGFDHRK